MRVGVNCFLLEPHIGGLKQYFINLFDWLLEYDHDNEYVFFYFRHNDVELSKLRSDRWRAHSILLENQDQISAHLKDLDVYFCPFSALWPRPVPIPSVMTLVDIQEVFYPQFFTRQERYSREYHYPASTRTADRVVTISEFSKSSLVQHHRLPHQKVIVSYLCADPQYFQASEIQTPPSAVLPSKFVFFPANRWYHKNHDVLLRALAALKNRGEETNAVLTGFDVGGGYPVGKKAEEHGVGGNVYSAGYVTVPQMAYLYRHAEMLVFPSLFEGFGMPPIEAMAAGCPAVVSRNTCLPEICGPAAEYFDSLDPLALADGICRVRNDKVRREELVRQGRQQARLFSPERMARAHLEAFNQATRAYSSPHFWWHSLFYERFHKARVDLRGAISRRREARQDQDNCTIAFTRGWHFREQNGEDWLRWTDGKGGLKVHAPRAVKLLVRGEIASVQRPNDVRVFVNEVLLKSWTLDGEFGFIRIPDLVLELDSGDNIVHFESSRAGIQCSPGDTRFLAIAVRNLSFSDSEGVLKCIPVD